MTEITSKKDITYQKRIFAFIDILGFAYLIEESKEDPTRIIDIYNLLEDAKKMIAAGATRIGASASIAIVTGTKAGAGKY